MKYCHYNLTTGEIVGFGECSDEFVDLQKREGYGIYKGEGKEGDLIDVTGVAPALVPNGRGMPPSNAHAWVHGAGWVPDLDKVRAEKKRLINAERSRRITAPYAYDGGTVDASPISQQSLGVKVSVLKLRAVSGKAPKASSLVWRMADNTTRAFTSAAQYEQWLDNLMVELEARTSDAYAWSWDKKAQVDAATTYEQLDAIDPTV